MSDVHVEAARIPDRDRLLDLLRGAGLDARPVDEVEIEVHASGSDEITDSVYAHVEELVMSVGSTFVPIKHEGVIYVRPPVG